MERQSGSELRELGRYWGSRKPLRDAEGSLEAPEKREPLGKYGVGGGNPQESRRTPQRMCGKLRGGLGEWSVF